MAALWYLPLMSIDFCFGKSNVLGIWSDPCGACFYTERGFLLMLTFPKVSLQIPHTVFKVYPLQSEPSTGLSSSCFQTGFGEYDTAYN